MEEEKEIINIILELRGKTFTVYRSILLNVPGTYFFTMLSSGVWQPNRDGVYVINRPSEGFERILDCLSTGELDCRGLNEYEIECVYANVDYFVIPFVRVWDYSSVSRIENMKIYVYLQLKDGRICGRVSAKRICIFNMDTNVIETTLYGHTDTIQSIIQLEDGRICSCSIDSDLKLWNIESGHCEYERSINGISTTHLCNIELEDGRLCSGSGRFSVGRIKVWNIEYEGYEETIGAKGPACYCIVQLKDGRICCGRHDGIVQIRYATSGSEKMNLVGHSNYIKVIVVIDELRICSSSADNTIRVWDVGTGVCILVLEEHTSDISDMIVLLDGRICSVSYYGSTNIWNIETGEYDLTATTSTSSLYRVIQLQDGQLLVSNCKGEVYVIG
jgi:WD40 repeat protein